MSTTAEMLTTPKGCDTLNIVLTNLCFGRYWPMARACDFLRGWDCVKCDEKLVDWALWGKLKTALSERARGSYMWNPAVMHAVEAWSLSTDAAGTVKYVCFKHAHPIACLALVVEALDLRFYQV